MAKKYRIESTSLGQYLDAVYDGEIKLDQSVQRDFCWSRGMMNSLVYSAVSQEIYIPPIILAEEKKKDGTTKTYVIDAGQRSETLRQFKYGGYKLTKDLRSYLIPYQKEKCDANGNVIYDEYGDAVCEIVYFDLRGKTYDNLPDALQKNFNKCQMTQVVYQDRTPDETSELVLLYNNHMGMNVSQKSLTYVGKFADEIKRIKNTNRFLIDGTALTNNEKKKGLWERVISECVMAVNHFEDWKSQPNKMCDYLNQHSSEEEYKNIEKYFNRLAPYVDKLKNKNVSDLFVSKNIAVWMMLFDRFDKLHISDNKFGEFLDALVNGLNSKEIDGIDWTTLNADKHTKDKSVISKKVNHLETLMMEFLHSDIKELEDCSKNKVSDNCFNIEEFVAECVDMDVSEITEDMDFYNQSLDDVLEAIENEDSKLLQDSNRPSLLAMVVWSYKEDFDLEDWMKEYSKKNNTYLMDQKKNFNIMLDDFKRYDSEMKTA